MQTARLIGAGCHARSKMRCVKCEASLPLVPQSNVEAHAFDVLAKLDIGTPVAEPARVAYDDRGTEAKLAEGSYPLGCRLDRQPINRSKDFRRQLDTSFAFWVKHCCRRSHFARKFVENTRRNKGLPYVLSLSDIRPKPKTCTTKNAVDVISTHSCTKFSVGFADCEWIDLDTGECRSGGRFDEPAGHERNLVAGICDD